MKKLIVAVLLVGGASVAYGEFYTWKDGRGVAHYTNSLHEIPARYRQKARVLDVATGKLGGPATAQPAQKTPQNGAAGSQSPPQPSPAASPVTPPPAAPAAPAVAVPAAPPAVNPALPPPSRDAVRRMNRIRARTGLPEE